MLAFGWLIILERGVVQVTWSILEFYTPLNFSGMAEDKIVTFCARFAWEALVLWWQTVPQVGVVKVTWRLFFGKLVLISRKRYKTDVYLQWTTNRKSYMAYEMAATAVTLNDLECRSQVAGLFKHTKSNIVQHFTRFQLTVCSRGFSALVELLVKTVQQHRRLENEILTGCK